MDRRWLGTNPMMVGVLGGRLTFQEDFGLPFAEEAARALAEFGVPNERTATVEAAYPELPKFEPDLPPTAALGFEDLIVGLGLYLAGSLTDATIGLVVEHLYQQRIQPAVTHLWSKVTSAAHRPKTTRVLLDHWFDGSGVLVRVEFILSSEDAAPDSETVRACLTRAANWINTNPRTHRVLTFTVASGEMQATPRLSEPIR